jgi:membrane dipeptidase
MKFFDAHCDTAKRVLDGEVDFHRSDGGGHVSLPGMLAAGIQCQLFAVFVLSRDHPGEERARAEEMIATVYRLAEGSQGKMRVVTTAEELRQSFAAGPIAALIGLEGADPLEGVAENLRHFFELGVRNLIPAWLDNPFSGTAFGSDRSLTPEGEALVQLAEDLGVMVDVSHLSDPAFWRTLEATKKPLIASHSNCRALCPSPRNLTDQMIRALADRGGVMGINLSPGFLDPEYYERTRPLVRRLLQEELPAEEKVRLREELKKIPRPDLEWIARHVRHAIQVGGEDVIGLGGDLDGISATPLGIETVADYALLPELLERAGLVPRQVEKVCYRNFLRVFSEVLPSAPGAGARDGHQASSR